MSRRHLDVTVVNAQEEHNDMCINSGQSSAERVRHPSGESTSIQSPRMTSKTHREFGQMVTIDDVLFGDISYHLTGVSRERYLVRTTGIKGILQPEAQCTSLFFCLSGMISRHSGLYPLLKQLATKQVMISRMPVLLVFFDYRFSFGT